MNGTDDLNGGLEGGTSITAMPAEGKRGDDSVEGVKVLL